MGDTTRSSRRSNASARPLRCSHGAIVPSQWGRACLAIAWPLLSCSPGLQGFQTDTEPRAPLHLAVLNIELVASGERVSIEGTTIHTWLDAGEAGTTMNIWADDDLDGLIRAEVAPGSLRGRVDAPGFLVNEFVEARMEAGAVVTRRIELEVDSILRGRVVSAGMPVHDARVSLVASDPRFVANVRTSRGEAERCRRCDSVITTTDANGEFEFARLTPGSYRLRGARGVGTSSPELLVEAVGPVHSSRVCELELPDLSGHRRLFGRVIGCDSLEGLPYQVVFEPHGAMPFAWRHSSTDLSCPNHESDSNPWPWERSNTITMLNAKGEFFFDDLPNTDGTISVRAPPFFRSGLSAWIGSGDGDPGVITVGALVGARCASRRIGRDDPHDEVVVLDGSSCALSHLEIELARGSGEGTASDVVVLRDEGDGVGTPVVAGATLGATRHGRLRAPAGRLCVVARTELGIGVVTDWVDVEPGASVSLTQRYPWIVCRFECLDESGQPLAGGQVSISMGSLDSSRVLDPQGRFALDLTAGSYELRYAPDPKLRSEVLDYEVARVNVNATESTHRVTFRRATVR